MAVFDFCLLNKVAVWIIKQAIIFLLGMLTRSSFLLLEIVCVALVDGDVATSVESCYQRIVDLILLVSSYPTNRPSQN